MADGLDSLWNDKLVIVSKKRVKTWKGLILVSIAAALGLMLLLIINTTSKNNCGLEDKNVYPLNCQKFTYTDWSVCQPDGTQKREVIEKLPANCQGGVIPEIVQPCQ